MAPIRRVCNGRGGQAEKETVLQGRWTFCSIDPFHAWVIWGLHRGEYYDLPPVSIAHCPSQVRGGVAFLPRAFFYSQDSHWKHKCRTFLLPMHDIAPARLLASACWRGIGRGRLLRKSRGKPSSRYLANARYNRLYLCPERWGLCYRVSSGRCTAARICSSHILHGRGNGSESR